MFRTLEVSASGLAAQRTRMDTIAGNIAHAGTTLDENGNVAPFQRRLVILEAVPLQSSDGPSSSAVAASVEIDTATPPRQIYQPGHPHANDQGFVSYPDIDPITEFVNAMEASRAYEANINTMDVTREMIDNTFRLIA